MKSNCIFINDNMVRFDIIDCWIMRKQPAVYIIIAEIMTATIY